MRIIHFKSVYQDNRVMFKVCTDHKEVLVMDKKEKVKNIFSSMLPYFELVEGNVSSSIKQLRLWGKEYSLTKWDEVKYKENLKKINSLYQSNSSSLVEDLFSSALAKVLVSYDQKNQ